jgi:hypothetical protein
MRASAKATTTKNLSRTSKSMVGKCLDIPLYNIDHRTSLISSDGQQFVDTAIAVVFNHPLSTSVARHDPKGQANTDDDHSSLLEPNGHDCLPMRAYHTSLQLLNTVGCSLVH